MGLRVQTISVTGRKKTQNEGFTLIELVLVGVILSILLSLSVPMFNQIYSSEKLKTGTQELVGTLRYAYQAAVSDGVRYKLVFSLDNEEYWLQKEMNGTSGGTGTFTDIQTALVKPRYLPEGIIFRRVSAQSLVFNPNGGGDNIKIYLQNKKNQVFTVWYNGLSGQVQVFDYDKQ